MTKFSHSSLTKFSHYDILLIMEIQFEIHNLHHEDPILFENKDPHLRRLKNQAFQYQPHLLSLLPFDIPGIYSVGGGRQVGKTTALKQWMLQLIKKKVPPKLIKFLTGEMIPDYQELLRLIQTSLTEMTELHKEAVLFYLLIDDVTYIKNWEKAIKFSADAGLFENVVVILTGSDLVMMQAARMTFPGRRGKASQTDFHLYPLSFRECVRLTKTLSEPLLSDDLAAYSPTLAELSLLMEAFQSYLVHGGYLTAINDWAHNKTILPATLQTYSDWIRGDILKKHKQEHYLREIIVAIIKHYGSQITWNNLSQSLSIDHPKTVADYIELLQSMDAVFIQHALMQDKLTLAPKKAKKVMFNDPFIYHSLRAWLQPCDDSLTLQIQPLLADSVLVSQLVESVVVTHYRRFYETFYIKAEGEVDLAYIKGERFYPVEIKWTEQLRKKNLKQITKYPEGLILTKSLSLGEIQNVKTVPMVWDLYCLGLGLDSSVFL
jgi:predicted AAA+ superfamily ATPase